MANKTFWSTQFEFEGLAFFLLHSEVISMIARHLMLAGGATWWKLLLQNRIYVAARLGTNNTLFTTHTTNPQWAAVLRMAAATIGRSTSSDNAHANWDLLVRAFLEAREPLRDLLKHGNALPVAVRGPAKWMLETVESQLRGLLHGHSVQNYGEPWSTAITDQTSVARKPMKEEDAYWCAKCNRPPGTYIDLVNRHCIRKCTDNYCKGTQGRPCRFGFPFASTPMTYVDSDDRVQYRRNVGDEWIHPQSPCLLLALLGHLHQTPLHGPGAIPYTASYAPSHSTGSIASRAVPEPCLHTLSLRASLRVPFPTLNP